MADKRYRCGVCIGDDGRNHEFVSGDPPIGVKCPRCGSPGGHVVQLVRVHLYFPDPQGPVVGHNGRRLRIACQPDKVTPPLSHHGNFAATGEASAVTCEHCKKTKDYAMASDLEQAAAGGVMLE